MKKNNRQILNETIDIVLTKKAYLVVMEKYTCSKLATHKDYNDLKRVLLKLLNCRQFHKAVKEIEAAL